MSCADLGAAASSGMTLPAPVVDQFAKFLIEPVRARATSGRSCSEDLPPGDWEGLRDRVAATVAAIQEIHYTRDPTIHAGSSVPLVVAAAIEKLGPCRPRLATLARPICAYLWTLSVKPLHRARAEAWMFAHADATAAFERDTADEHIAVILEGRSVQDEAARFVPALPPRLVRFAALRDEEAAVWSATSDEHISTEAPSREELLDRLKVIVPDVLESREGRIGPLTIVVDWQEVRTVDRSTLAIA